MNITLTTPLGLNLEIIEDRERVDDFMVKSFTMYFKIPGYDVLSADVDRGVLQITAERALEKVK